MNCPVLLRLNISYFIEGNWYLCLKVYFPIQFNEIAHAFEVECQPSWIVVLPQDLADSHKHRIYRRDAKTNAFTVFHMTEFHKDI